MKRVRIYSNNNCGACKTAKIFMTAQKIEFDEINIDENQTSRHYLKHIGVKSLPFIKVGEKEIRGFIPSEILEAVKA